VFHQRAFFVSFASGTLLVLRGTLATVVLAVVWGGALAGIVLELLWTGAPRWLGGTMYLALGWVAVVTMPQLFALPTA
jgi:hemolysin III